MRWLLLVLVPSYYIDNVAQYLAPTLTSNWRMLLLLTLHELPSSLRRQQLVHSVYLGAYHYVELAAYALGIPACQPQ
jgi:hypothetical protein